ncbi:MAG: spermidine synthase [Verrucomicrobiota bacterium]
MDRGFLLGDGSPAMARDFEELDYRETRMGELILRRRRVKALDDLEVFEVILGDAFLMTSMFNAVEIALSELGLAAHPRSESLEVVVGGLGLGYTAQAALKHDSVEVLLVVDALAEVIEWHEKGLVPVGSELCADERCRLVHGDFFALAGQPEVGFDPDRPGRLFDAVLLDVDHTPSKLLDASHASFYQKAGLQALAAQLREDGIFAMWSDDPPDEFFMASLKEVFTDCRAEEVAFFNPLQEQEAKSTVYVASK